MTKDFKLKPGCTPVFLTGDNTPVFLTDDGTSVPVTADTAPIPAQRAEEHYRVAIDLDGGLAFVVNDVAAPDPDTAAQVAGLHLRDVLVPGHFITGWHVDRIGQCGSQEDPGVKPADHAHNTIDRSQLEAWGLVLPTGWSVVLRPAHFDDRPSQFQGEEGQTRRYVVVVVRVLDDRHVRVAEVLDGCMGWPGGASDVADVCVWGLLPPGDKRDLVTSAVKKALREVAQ